MVKEVSAYIIMFCIFLFDQTVQQAKTPQSQVQVTQGSQIQINQSPGPVRTTVPVSQVNQLQQALSRKRAGSPIIVNNQKVRVVAASPSTTGRVASPLSIISNPGTATPTGVRGQLVQKRQLVTGSPMLVKQMSSTNGTVSPFQTITTQGSITDNKNGNLVRIPSSVIQNLTSNPKGASSPITIHSSPQLFTGGVGKQPAQNLLISNGATNRVITPGGTAARALANAQGLTLQAAQAALAGARTVKFPPKGQRSS